MTVELKKLFEVDAALNERMVETILKAIKEKHEQGMDYLKFKQSIQNLQAMAMDEVTSIKSAFATASTMGMDKAALIKSVVLYQAVIDQERDKFIDSLKNQIKAKIEDPKEELGNVDDKILKIRLKIEDLQKEIAILEASKITMQEEITTQEEKIENIRKDFLSVYEAFTKNLSDDRGQFEQLL